MGFVFQQFHLLDDLTVAENLEIPLSYRRIRKSERGIRLLAACSPRGARRSHGGAPV